MSLLDVVQFEDAFGQAERCETVVRNRSVTGSRRTIEFRTTFYPILMHRLANMPKEHGTRL